MTNQAIDMNKSTAQRAEVGQVRWLDEEIAEISLLLPGWQASRLVSLATSQRATVGQLLRGLIRKHLVELSFGDDRQDSESQAL